MSEFALLADGRRVILHDERGFTMSPRFGPGGEIETSAMVELLTETVLVVVSPDDDDSEDDHPWLWLTELARARGLDVSEAELRALPYEVALAESATRWAAVSD